MKIKSLKRLIYKIFLLFPFSQKILMRMFNLGGIKTKTHLYQMVAKRPPKIFRKDLDFEVDTWNAQYIHPIRKTTYSLDWDLAFSMGHDPEIRYAYKKLIEQGAVLKFIDVGANYGLHSLFFLSHGISTATIEPNPECIKYFNNLMKYNKFNSDVFNIAVSNNTGEATLYWPQSETWLGTLNLDDLSNKLISSHLCEVNTIDNLSLVDGYKQLIKIDVEGHELQVLEGALESIKRWSPSIIFESFQNPASRLKIYKYFDKLNYELIDLIAEKTFVELNQFNYSKSKNFLAKSK